MSKAVAPDAYRKVLVIGAGVAGLVLLAEAKVPYDIVLEMDEINH